MIQDFTRSRLLYYSHQMIMQIIIDLICVWCILAASYITVEAKENDLRQHTFMCWKYTNCET